MGKRTGMLLLPAVLAVLTACGGSAAPQKQEPPADGYVCTVTPEECGRKTELPGCCDYFYSILDDADRKLYDCMLDVIQHNDRQYTAAAYYPPEHYDADTLNQYTHRIFEMLQKDHPEIFWQNYYWKASGDDVHTWETAQGESVTRFDLGDQKFEKDGKTGIRFVLPASYPDKDAEEERLEQAVSALLAELDLSGTEAERAEIIHDRLLDLLHFDHRAYGKWAGYQKSTADGGSVRDAVLQDYAKLDFRPFTVYGALVESDTGANQCVCDGYAAAYQYLLKKAGIMAVHKTGVHGLEGKADERHAWNAVRIDGKWYETDLTEDDYEVAEQRISQEQKQEMLGDADFMYRVRHLFYGLTTAQMKKMKRNLTYTFSDGTEYDVKVGTVVHIEDQDAADALFPLYGLLPASE